MNGKCFQSSSIILALLVIFIFHGLTIEGQSKVKVESYNQVPTLFINDVPRNGNSLFIYNVQGTYTYKSVPWLEQFKSYIDEASRTKVTYVSFYFGLDFLAFQPNQPILTTDHLDFSKMDQFFNYAEEKGIYILPVINFSNGLLWWASENEDKLQTSYDGLVDGSVGFGYTSFREAVNTNIELIIKHYRDHPALLGWDVRIGVTAENNYGPSYLRNLDDPPESWCDYSASALAKFRSWLREQYADDLQLLQESWNDESLTFEDVQVPIPEEIFESPFPEILELINGSGDIRKSFKDWITFRLEVKTEEYVYFIEKVASTDPNHIIAIDPAGNLGMDINFVSKNGFNDFQELLYHPEVDIVVRHPRISIDETPGSFNARTESLKVIVQNDLRTGNISTFAMEDTGERVTGIDSIDSHSRINALAHNVSMWGGNMGLVIGQINNETENGLPIFRSAELETFSEQQERFIPENRIAPEPSKTALLIDYKGQSAMSNISIPGFSRAFDRLAFIKSIYGFENAPDIITAEEIIKNEVNLRDYKGLIVAHQSHLSSELASLIRAYNEEGGRVFLAGLNGIYDDFGNVNFESFSQIIGNVVPEVYEFAAFRTGSIVQSPSQLVTEFANEVINDGNLYNLLLSNWEDQGFEVLAEGEDVFGTKMPIILSKENVIVHFGNIGNISASWKLDYYKNILDFLSQGMISNTSLDIVKPKGNTLVYPNPTNDIITIDSREIIERIEIVDAFGNTILVKEEIGLNEYSLSVDEFLIGIYLIKIFKIKGSDTKWFVKH